MSTWLYRLGRSSARHPWRYLLGWLAITVAVVGLSAGFGKEFQDTFDVPGLDSSDAVQLLSEAESDTAGLTSVVVLTPIDGEATFLDSTQARTELAEAHDRLRALPHVIGATDPAALLAEGIENAVASGTVSADGRVALVRLQYPPLEELDPVDLSNLKAAVAELREGSSLQIEARGDLFFEFETPPTGTAELVGLGAAVVILLIAFGSAVAMGLPIIVALFGLAIGITSLSLVGHAFDVPSFAPVIASMVGLGAGIDYALFLVSRHRENLAAGLVTDESIARTVATAGQAVVFAGGTVVISILGMAVAGIPFITAAGFAISIVVLLMVAAAISLLPALLSLVGERVNRLHLPIGRRPDAASASGITVSGRWERWGRHVSGHAVVYTVGTTALLLTLTAPVLALDLGYFDEGVLPESRTERRAYDLASDGFGVGTNGPLVVAVDISDDPTVVEPLAEAVARDPGVLGATVVDVDPEAGVASVMAIPSTSPQDQATRLTVERLRTEVMPEVLADSPAKAHVGGQTASFADLAERVNDRLWPFITAVVGLSFLLLTLVFRSILVPLKAAILNLLSIGSAYGVLVMVFQWEWGASLIGVDGPVPIVSFIPLMMFAIVFGLSMDYEVFLLSRVREHYDQTGDNGRAVVAGLAGTARVITSAALIMVSVFTAFAMGQDPIIKMLGLGLATAIAVDATIVRMILVPATMSLLGDRNWWLPGWLDRILPTVTIDAPAHSTPVGTPPDDGLVPPGSADKERSDRIPVGAR